MYMTRLKKICRKIQNFFSKVEIGIEAAAKGGSFSFVSNSIWRQRKRGFLLYFDGGGTTESRTQLISCDMKNGF